LPEKTGGRRRKMDRGMKEPRTVHNNETQAATKTKGKQENERVTGRKNQKGAQRAGTQKEKT